MSTKDTEELRHAFPLHAPALWKTMWKMAVEQEQASLRRRRVKGNVWFNHGHETVFEESKSRAESTGQRWRQAIRVIWALLKIFALAFLITISVGILLRSTSTICSILPITPNFCQSTWLQPQHSIIDTIFPGTTPTTRTLKELTNLNKMSTQLEFVGFATHLTMLNLSTLFPHLEESRKSLKLSEEDLSSLANAANTAQEMIEQLSQDDYHFRHKNLVEGQFGLKALNENMHLLATELEPKKMLALALSEQAHYRTPVGGARLTISYTLLNLYFHFLREQWSKVEGLVKVTSETRMVLREFLGEMGRLERKAEAAKYEHLRQITMMRKAVEWTSDVVKIAEARYKDLYLELRKTTDALDEETKGYGSFWPSGKLLGLKRLRKMVEVERRQLGGYFEEAEKAQGVVFEIGSELMEGQVEGFVDRKLEAAILKRELEWW